VFALVPSAGLRALAAGVSWTCRTHKAPWAARLSHTSVVDAFGAIYVIGGNDGGDWYLDVWVSTDGGSRPDSAGWSGVLRGYSGVLQGYYRGTMWYYVVV
jgi:hypothetical protein